jgi:hypothetical protein
MRGQKDGYEPMIQAKENRRAGDAAARETDQLGSKVSFTDSRKNFLPQEAADRLTKLLGMLGSEHDGERATAAAKANAFVRAMGLTWRDIISPPLAPDHAPRIRSWRANDSNWRRMAEFCHARRWQLNQKDRDFVRSMLNWRQQPTERQREWLLDLYARLHRGGAR